jgi:hypothetical protein
MVKRIFSGAPKPSAVSRTSDSEFPKLLYQEEAKMRRSLLIMFLLVMTLFFVARNGYG